MHSRQQLSGVVTADTRGPLAAPVTGVAQPLDPGVALPAVGDHGGAWLDVCGEERVQGRGGGVGDDAPRGQVLQLRIKWNLL